MNLDEWKEREGFVDVLIITIGGNGTKKGQPSLTLPKIIEMD